MSNFNEHALEMGFMELFEQQGYSYQSGKTIHKELSEVILKDDLRLYLMDRYAQEGITPLEVERVIAKLTADNGAPLYEQNAQTYRLMTEGFAIKREDASLLDLFVEVIDFDDTERNIFKVPEQAPEQVNDLLHTSNTYIIRLIKEKIAYVTLQRTRLGNGLHGAV